MYMYLYIHTYIYEYIHIGQQKKIWKGYLLTSLGEGKNTVIIICFKSLSLQTKRPPSCLSENE